MTRTDWEIPLVIPPGWPWPHAVGKRLRQLGVPRGTVVRWTRERRQISAAGLTRKLREQVN